MNHLGQRGSNRNIRPSPLGSPARTTTYMAANSTHPTVTTRCEQIGIHRRSDTTTKSSVVKIIIGHVFLFFSFPPQCCITRVCVCVCVRHDLSAVSFYTPPPPPPLRANLQTPPPFRRKANTWRHFLSGKKCRKRETILFGGDSFKK
jgi:hypothetical protein